MDALIQADEQSTFRPVGPRVETADTAAPLSVASGSTVVINAPLGAVVEIAPGETIAGISLVLPSGAQDGAIYCLRNITEYSIGTITPNGNWPGLEQLLTSPGWSDLGLTAPTGPTLPGYTEWHFRYRAADESWATI